MTREVDKLVGEWKVELINNFAKLDHKVSICADIWSESTSNQSYLGVTCHWVDDSWTLQKRLIAYREFDTDHTAQNICQKLRTIFHEHGLMKKIFHFHLIMLVQILLLYLLSVNIVNLHVVVDFFILDVFVMF